MIASFKLFALLAVLSSNYHFAFSKNIEIKPSKALATIQKIQNQHHKQISSFLPSNVQSPVRARATSECDVLELEDDLEYSEAAVLEALLLFEVFLWGNTTDNSFDFLEKMPTFVAETKVHCNDAGGSMYYLSYSLLDCPSLGDEEMTAGLDGTFENFPLCVKGCDNPTAVEAYAETNGCVAEFTSDGNVMYGTGIVTLASIITSLTFFFM
jgi:hypothetical protein